MRRLWATRVFFFTLLLHTPSSHSFTLLLYAPSRPVLLGRLLACGGALESRHLSSSLRRASQFQAESWPPPPPYPPPPP
eukprot:357940-Prorocentrum_minimum.AAC.1